MLQLELEIFLFRGVLMRLGAPFMSFHETVANTIFPFPLAGLNLKLPTTITRNLFYSLAHDTLTNSLRSKSKSLGSIYSRTVGVNRTGLYCINMQIPFSLFRW